MKLRLLTSILLVISITAFAQDKKKNYSFGGSLHGTLATAFNSSTSSELMGPDFKRTFQRYNDSIQEFETYRYSFGATVWGFYQLNKNWQLQAGLSYVDLGFQREQNNIQFGDKLFPGIGSGMLLDLSSGSGDKNIKYNYRYHYLQVPLMINYHLYQSHDFKYTYVASAGVAMNFLLNHSLNATLEQFTVDGETSFNLDSTGYSGDGFNASLLLSFRGEYRLEKSIHLFLQPIMGYSPLSASTGQIQSNQFYLQLNAGVIYFMHE